MRRQSYIEFDLQSMMEGEKFADFVIFYRLLHRSRFPEAVKVTKVSSGKISSPISGAGGTSP